MLPDGPHNPDLKGVNGSRVPEQKNGAYFPGPMSYIGQQKANSWGPARNATVSKLLESSRVRACMTIENFTRLQK